MVHRVLDLVQRNAAALHGVERSPTQGMGMQPVLKACKDTDVSRGLGHSVGCHRTSAVWHDWRTGSDHDRNLRPLEFASNLSHVVLPERCRVEKPFEAWVAGEGTIWNSHGEEERDWTGAPAGVWLFRKMVFRSVKRRACGRRSVRWRVTHCFVRAC